MNESIIFNRSKIVATVGPASNNPEMLEKLILAGVDVFRLNFSHGSHDVHSNVINTVRALNDKMRTQVSLLQDLQGPKIRTREIENGEVHIQEGDELVITTEKLVGNAKRISTTYESMPKDVSIGERILIDDGKIELEVIGKTDIEIKTRIIYGGSLKSRKGINLPNTKVSAPSLTEKDIEDLHFGLDNDIDWVALSFVRSAKDIVEIKKIISERGKNTKVVAKIEKPQALENIDEIIAVTDAIMVARGDLGVEIPAEEVPMAQKMIVSKCNLAHKPVIIATQMMESMIENPRPTRAETNDVANAIMDGADAVMLSAETAAGKYPIEAVKSMVKTIISVEKNDAIYDKFHDIDPEGVDYIHNHLVQAACKMATTTGAKAILGMTKSGYTGFRLAGHRPKANVFVFTSDKKMLTTLNLVWGVRGFFYDKQVSTDETFNDIAQIVKDAGYLQKGDVYINTASMPLHWQNRTNMLKIEVMK
jgi:pyruvate kinase